MKLTLSPDELAQFINKHFNTKTAAWSHENDCIVIDYVMEKLNDAADSKISKLIIKERPIDTMSINKVMDIYNRNFINHVNQSYVQTSKNGVFGWLKK